MHRFHLPPERCGADRFALSETDARHAAQVLRLRPGDAAEVLDGVGTVLRCRLLHVDKRRVEAECLSRQTHPAPRRTVTLFQAVTKPKAMEWILQKAVELGAHAVVPLLAERSVSRLESDEAEDRRARWHAIVVEAAKQCGAPWFPQLAPPQSLPHAIPTFQGCECRLVASLAPGTVHPRTALTMAQAQLGHRPACVGIAIGPEGDFSPEELAIFQQAGATAVTLGPQVLRAETAAVVALAVLQYELAWGPETSLPAP